ncbi:MAG: LPXTG cell wall anchor domain-containing protein [Nitrospira sp.]|nr:LPXTG cell wall anchor domain-containing protein [Nitrospira sp.]
MIAWLLLGGLVMIMAGGFFYRTRRQRRRVSSGSHTVMTKTTDGELLQFLVRPTRRSGKDL